MKNEVIKLINKSEQEIDGFIKNDAQKPNMAILFDTNKALGEVANVMQYGAKKYDRRNWSKCDDKERYVSASLRHLGAYANKETIDKESGYSHLAHAVCSILFLLEMDLEAKR